MGHPYFKSFINDNITVLAGNTLIYMKAIILMPIIIKTVGIKTYGGFVLLSSVFGIVHGVSLFGADFKAKRLLPSTVSIITRRDLFYPQFFWGLFTTISFSLFLLLINNYINTILFKNDINYSAAIIPVYLISYFFFSQGVDYLRYTSKIKHMSVASILFPYVHIFLIIIFVYVYNYININILVITKSFSAFFVSAICFWYLIKEIGFHFSTFTLSELSSEIKIGFPLVLSFLVDFILASCDRYFIAYFIGVASVGYYNPGYVLGSLIIFIPKAMGTALPQLLSKAFDNNDHYEAQKMLNYTITFFLVLAIPFVLGNMMLGKQILTLLANDDVANKSHLISSIVAIGMLFYGLNIILTNILYVKMETCKVLRVNILTAMLNLFTNIILLYLFRAIIVAAITTMVSYIFSFIYLYFSLTKEWKVEIKLSIIMKSLTSALIMILFLYFWQSILKEITLATLFLELAFGSLIYFISILILKIFSFNELYYLKRAIINQSS